MPVGLSLSESGWSPWRAEHAWELESGESGSSRAACRGGVQHCLPDGRRAAYGCSVACAAQPPCT